MGKKGVAQISGVVKPIVGETYTYSVTGWYPDTEPEKRNPNNVTWELFKQRSLGKFTTTNIRKKGISSFTFGEKAVGSVYKLQAYLYEPEGGGLIITPKPAKVPKINKVELFYVDDKKGSTFSFMEKLRARAYCVNMLMKELVFTLWEDDAKGEGHNANNKPIETRKAKVDKNGIAVTEFVLTKALMKKAMQGETDPKQLEFYVTVEYYSHKKHATDNINVNNPFPPINGEMREDKKTVPKAKDSPAASKFPSRKEEKGILGIIVDKSKELWDWSEISGIIKKDKEPTRQEFEKTKSAAMVKEIKVNKTQTEKCFCNRDFEEKDVRQFVKLLKGSETIWEGQALKGGKRAECNISDKSFATLTKELNYAFKKYSINTCAQKMHFLAQVTEETGTFSLSEETKSKYASSQSILQRKRNFTIDRCQKK